MCPGWTVVPYLPAVNLLGHGLILGDLEVLLRPLVRHHAVRILGMTQTVAEEAVIAGTRGRTFPECAVLRVRDLEVRADESVSIDLSRTTTTHDTLLCPLGSNIYTPDIQI